MATKPYSQLSPKTQKRLTNFGRKLGLSGEQVHATPGLLQRARGHKPQEHLTRVRHQPATRHRPASKKVGKVPKGLKFKNLPKDPNYTPDPGSLARALRAVAGNRVAIVILVVAQRSPDRAGDVANGQQMLWRPIVLDDKTAAITRLEAMAALWDDKTTTTTPEGEKVEVPTMPPERKVEAWKDFVENFLGAQFLQLDQVLAFEVGPARPSAQ